MAHVQNPNPYLTRPSSVGLRGFKLNPALLSYVIAGPRARLPRRSGRHHRELRISKRLEAEAIELWWLNTRAGRPPPS
jgi:hypothetical protein